MVSFFSGEVLYIRFRRFIRLKLPLLDTLLKRRFESFYPVSISPHPQVILCGLNTVGKQIARALLLSNIPFNAIDCNSYTVSKIKREGIHVMCADPADVQILKCIHTSKANTLISVGDDLESHKEVIVNAHKVNPHIITIIYTNNKEAARYLKDLGAHAVICPEHEAVLSIVRKIFRIQHIPKELSISNLQHFKLEHGY